MAAHAPRAPGACVGCDTTEMAIQMGLGTMGGC